MNAHWPLREKFQRLFFEPLFWILLAAALMRIPGLFWGLPGSDGWDDDGIAPRNFLVGLAQTYAPGSYFTYPPLHMILLAVLTLPGWLLALFEAPSLTPHGVIAEIIRVPYMTFFAVVARVVSAAMSLATIYIIARMAALIGGRRAGWFAAAACAINSAFTYYGQVSNLEAPYLFWSALSLLAWMRLIREHDLKQVRNGVLTAVAAIATKDQAYGIFLFSVPAAFALLFASEDWQRRNMLALLAALARWLALGLVLLLLIDGAITNPAGFASRLAFLTGSASQDYAQYTSDWGGRIRLIADMGANFTRYYPLPFALLALFGIGMSMVRLRANAPESVTALVPLLAAVSFTIAFNFVALRSEVRFLLPQSVFLALYAGLAAERLAFLPQLSFRLAARLFLATVAAAGIYACVGVDAAFARDPRYDAESWMDAHIPKGASVETYGLNAYLPRFSENAVVTRLDVKPARLRNPLPHVREIDQPFGLVGSRRPQFLVVSDFWVRDYLVEAAAQTGEGSRVQAVKLTQSGQLEARDYFRALFGQRLRYRMAHRAQYVSEPWSVVEGYESLGQTIYIFESY